MRVALIDYESGNLHSAAKAVALVGADTVVITTDAVKKIEEWLA